MITSIRSIPGKNNQDRSAHRSGSPPRTGSRSAAPAIRPEPRAPGIGLAQAVCGASRAPGQERGCQRLAEKPGRSRGTRLRLRQSAHRRRVGLHGIGGYRGNPETAAPPALVMGFGNVRERSIEPAIAGVADLLS
jgi:hypothetical protein